MSTSPPLARFTLAEIEQQVCELTAASLNLPRHEVQPASRLIEDLHCDSLDIVELVMQIEDAFVLPLMGSSLGYLYEVIFTRNPFRVQDLAEIVYLYQGTGTPGRQGVRWEVVTPATRARRPEAEIPFTQLGSRWQPRLAAASQALFEPLTKSGRTPWFRRLTDGMRCRLIPSAEVEIGSPDLTAPPTEQPLHRVEIDAFLIDAEPVSTTAYCRFLNSITPSPEDLNRWFLLAANDDRVVHLPIVEAQGEWQPVAGMNLLPMVLVSWYGANAYALWANAGDWSAYQEQDEFLPTEAQWEYAARGATFQTFPWGDDSPTGDEMIYGQHQPGATYQAAALPMPAVHEPLGMSPFGLHHMAGNVWQWCRDWYDARFYQQPQSRMRNPVNRHKTGICSERGGSWVGPAELCRSSYRRGRNPDARGRCLGFRCISTTPPRLVER